MDERGTGTVADAEQQPRQLRRPRSGRVAAGVAAGLAQHLRLDVTLVRVLFVLAALLNLLGVLVYGLLWLLVPSEEAPDAPDGPAADSRQGPATPGVGFWAGVGLIALGAMWLLPWNAFGPLGPGFGGGLLLPLLLIGGGLALWLSEERRGPAGRPAEAAGAATSATAGPATPPTTPPTTPPGTPPPPAPPRGEGGDGGAGGAPSPPERERSPLVRVTLGAALLAAGALWLAGPAGLVSVRLEVVLGGALLVIGVGLLVGSSWGRGRLLILAGLPMSLLVLAAMAAPVVLPTVPFSGTVGQAQVVVSDAADLQEEYEHVAGKLRLDLRELELAEDAATRIAVGAGEVQILLPDELRVEVEATASVGELGVLGVRRSGIGPSLRHADGEGEATLSLEVRVGAGEVVVTRGPPPDGDGFWGPRRSERFSAPVGTVRTQEVVR